MSGEVTRRTGCQVKIVGYEENIVAFSRGRSSCNSLCFMDCTDEDEPKSTVLTLSWKKTDFCRHKIDRKSVV